MTAFVNHFAFEFKTGLRNQNHLLMNYLFPISFYLMMGLVMTQVNPLFPKTIIPAMIMLSTLSSTVLGLPGPLVESRESGIYRSFKINGVPAISILAMPALTTITHALIVTAIITVSAPIFFSGAAPVSWSGFVLVTLLSVFACGAIGTLLGVIARDSRTSTLLSQMIFLPSMLLGGLMMPLNLLPDSMQRVSALLPPTHAMQAYLGLAFRQETVINPIASATILLTSGLLAFGLAIYLFNWDSRNKARRGHPLMALLVLVPYLVGSFAG